MKYKIIKVVALLVILSHLSSCAKRVRTDNRRPQHGKYHAGDRWW